MSWWIDFQNPSIGLVEAEVGLCGSWQMMFPGGVPEQLAGKMDPCLLKYVNIFILWQGIRQ